MKPIINSQTGSSNVNYTLDMGGMTSDYVWELDEFKFHLATVATAANTLTISKLSKNGSAHDTNLLAVPMQNVGNIVWQPDRPIKLNGKDRLTVLWTNDAASFKTWGSQITFRA